MSGIETNIFPLLNLKSLSSKYKLYNIKGLNQSAQTNKNESYKKVNSLVTKLSYGLRIPVTYIQEQDEFFLVVRDDAKDLPEWIDVVRARLQLKQLDKTFDLNYAERSPNNDRICIKFLQFFLREPLGNDPRLWSPGAGRPFFDLAPFPLGDKILQHTGFKPRVVITHDGGIGICVDITHTHTSMNPLPTYLSRREFSRLANRHFIYRFGHKWYQIRAEYLDELNVSQSIIDTEKGFIPTIDFIYSRTEKPFPKELLNLPTDAAVIGYKNNRGEDRKAPAALCYQVFGPHDRIMKKHHRESILQPSERRNLIHRYVNDHLKDLHFGDTDLKVSIKPLIVPARKFVIPDFEYADRRVLSVRSTKGAQHVALDNLGETRLSLLKDGPGFFDSTSFKLPLSDNPLYGGEFLRREIYGRFESDG